MGVNYEIIGRQGTSLILDCLASHIGSHAIKFKLSHEEILRVKNSVIEELTEAINERT